MCPSWVRLGWLGFSPDKLVLSEDTVVHTGDARGLAPSEDAAGSLVCRRFVVSVVPHTMVGRLLGRLGSLSLDGL